MEKGQMMMKTITIPVGGRWSFEYETKISQCLSEEGRSGWRVLKIIPREDFLFGSGLTSRIDVYLEQPMLNHSWSYKVYRTSGPRIFGPPPSFPPFGKWQFLDVISIYFTLFLCRFRRFDLVFLEQEVTEQ